MSAISLTVSMRSNLLSLQNIASQQDIVQNRLATGLKVSSAIDNPSSYYTASSLNNRAADLTALLDAMSQGIQTIKAASEAIDSGTKFLEQAKAVANQALEAPFSTRNEEKIDYRQYKKLDKSWYQQQVGENGAVVETAQELLDAINSDKEVIVIYGEIKLQNTQIELQNNQKLVGTEYFANINANALYRPADEKHFSRLSFENGDNSDIFGIVVGSNSIVSDLKIEQSNNISLNCANIIIRGNNSSLKNLDISYSTMSTTQHSAIQITGKNATLSGNIDIQAEGLSNNKIGIYIYGGTAKINNAKLNIGPTREGIVCGSQGALDISDSLISHKGYYTLHNNPGAYGGATINIYGNTIINAQSNFVLDNLQTSTANPSTAKAENILNIAQGIKIYWQEQTTQKQYNLQTKQSFNISSINSDWILSAPEILELEKSGQIKTIINYDLVINSGSQKNYNFLIEQYNSLIGDASYKGVNLLTGQNLKINFNEDRSSKIDVGGVKADSGSLGLKTREWETVEDIEQSVSELETAINTLRGYASQYGNYYSIVTTRQDFTENLINVLEEGADKLTLADMNQESANMLALQTSQQLAVNSLSLASQASLSILKLF